MGEFVHGRNDWRLLALAQTLLIYTFGLFLNLHGFTLIVWFLNRSKSIEKCVHLLSFHDNIFYVTHL